MAAVGINHWRLPIWAKGTCSFVPQMESGDNKDTRPLLVEIKFPLPMGKSHMRSWSERNQN